MQMDGKQPGEIKNLSKMVGSTVLFDCGYLFVKNTDIHGRNDFDGGDCLWCAAGTGIGK